MPGYTLELSCPCGFRKKDVWVGVDESFVHMTFSLCLDRKKVVFLQKKLGGRIPFTLPHVRHEADDARRARRLGPCQVAEAFPGPGSLDGQGSGCR